MAMADEIINTLGHNKHTDSIVVDTDDIERVCLTDQDLVVVGFLENLLDDIASGAISPNDIKLKCTIKDLHLKKKTTFKHVGSNRTFFG